MAHISTFCQLYINPTLCNVIIDPLNTVLYLQLAHWFSWYSLSDMMTRKSSMGCWGYRQRKQVASACLFHFSRSLLPHVQKRVGNCVLSYLYSQAFTPWSVYLSHPEMFWGWLTLTKGPEHSIRRARDPRGQHASLHNGIYPGKLHSLFLFDAMIPSGPW